MSERERLVAHLERVSKKISGYVRAFVLRRGPGASFTAMELLDYVRQFEPAVAPGSPCRVMRDLAGRGLLPVECVDPGGGRYRVRR